jgi:hypothetical protein
MEPSTPCECCGLDAWSHECDCAPLTGAELDECSCDNPCENPGHHEADCPLTTRRYQQWQSVRP